MLIIYNCGRVKYMDFSAGNMHKTAKLNYHKDEIKITADENELHFALIKRALNLTIISRSVIL